MSPAAQHDDPRHDEDDLVLDEACQLVAAFGRQATAFQVLEPGVSRWLWPDGAGVVGYVEAAARYHVAAGNPVCARRDMARVALAFAHHAEARGRKAAFFGADDQLLDSLRDAGIEFDALRIGRMPEWDPAAYHTRGAARRTLRAQVNRGRNKGVTVRPLPTHALQPGTSTRRDVESVVHDWLDSRPMGPMGFMVAVEPFVHIDRRRYYLAEQHLDDDDRARPVAVLVASPVPACDGWFFENIVRVPDSPNGTVELLIDTAMRDLADTLDARYVSLGLAPLAGVDAAPGRHRLKRALMRWSYEHLGAIYNFEGLERFKARFAPDRWVPQYLVTIESSVSPWTVHAMLGAFSGGHLAFGAETARRWLQRLDRRVWVGALATMTALLVPWTAMLAAADAERWFGSQTVRTAWVGFDLAMLGGLSVLLTLMVRPEHARIASRLALVMSTLALGDFALSLHAAGALHPPPDGLWEWALTLAGCTAPLAATLLLLAIHAMPWLPHRDPC